MKVIVTASGHKLIFNDAAEGASITISDPNGNTVTLNASGITLKKESQQVVIAAANVSVNNGALVVR